MNDTTTTISNGRAGRWLAQRRGWLAGGALALAAGLTVAQPGGFGHGAGGHGGGGFGPGAMMFGGSPERAARMIDHLLDGLNATDAQRTQIKQIAAAAAADLKTQADAGRGLRDRGIQALTAANVDAGAAEQVRQQLLAQHDQVSRRTLTAMLDISRVLTPEQRVKLGERFKQRSDAMRERAQRMERDQQQRPARP